MRPAAVERVVELAVAKRNLAWSRANGGMEFGAGHYPAMVTLHSAFLVGCLAEVYLLHRPLFLTSWPVHARRRGRGATAALVVHHHARPAVEHPRGRHPRCAADHRRPVQVSSRTPITSP